MSNWSSYALQFGIYIVLAMIANFLFFPSGEMMDYRTFFYTVVVFILYDVVHAVFRELRA